MDYKVDSSTSEVDINKVEEEIDSSSDDSSSKTVAKRKRKIIREESSSDEESTLNNKETKLTPQLTPIYSSDDLPWNQN